MLSIIYKKSILKIQAVWYPGNDPEVLSDIVKNSNADIVFFHCAEVSSLKNAISVAQKTLVSDLRETPEEIYRKISRGHKRQITQARKNDIEIKTYTSAQIRAQPELLDELKDSYTRFTQQKGFDGHFNMNAVQRYIEADSLYLTSAFFNGYRLVWHMFIGDGKTARGMYSMSDFRNPSVDADMAVQANKLLHSSDLQYLRDIGYETHDWGGIWGLEEPTGIDMFKIRFGGTPKTYYNIFSGRSLLGKLAVTLMKLRPGGLFK